MATRDVDYNLRKKIHAFARDILSTGTLTAFKYMSFYIRGKEELLITVINEPLNSNPGQQNPASESNTPSSVHNKASTPSSSFTSGNLPYDKTSLMLSQTTQMKLSGFGDEGVGLPPASPSELEAVHDGFGSTLFLLACYSRYGSPYVWVRSNHERLIRLNKQASSEDKDNPLKLKTTNNWRKEGCHISEILAEVIKLCAYPAPQNPLAVDFQCLNDMSLHDRLLATASMMQFLEKVILSTAANKYYIPYVLEDYGLLTVLHIRTLRQMLSSSHLCGSQTNVMI